MYLETRKVGKAKKFYLTHSVRRNGKTRKIRVYLGLNLSKQELEVKKKEAEKKLLDSIQVLKVIHDPLETVLTPQESREVAELEAAIGLKITHLSEEDWQKFTEVFTYNTNAIEGSTVTLGEVEEILEKDKWPQKPRDEISETYGVAKTIEFIRKTREHATVELILELHRLVFGNSKPFAGKLREKGVEVVVADSLGNVLHRGAPSKQVKQLLEELFKWYSQHKNKYPPIVLAAVVHNQFENIHPFQDGNGRVGRLLLNNILLKHGLPPLNIELKNRLEYYATLQAFENKHNLRPSIELILKEYKELKKLLRK